MTADPVTLHPVRFAKPGGALHAVLAAVIAAAALGGAGLAPAMIRELRPDDIALIGLGLAGGLALAAGFLNAWRQPLLIVAPGCLTVPTFFGKRDIAVQRGQTVGELLATPSHGGSRAGGIEAGKFVHFYLMDAATDPILLVALHRAAPMVDDIRRALIAVAGLRVDLMVRRPGEVAKGGGQ